MTTTFKLRRDEAADWVAKDPILLAGEPGFESDTGKMKMGTGFHVWTALPYILPEPAVTSLIAEMIADATFEGVPGPKGDKGDTGDTGATGATGATGDTGPKGDTGDPGPAGSNGAAGATGAKGDKGDKGDTGDAGPQGDPGDPNRVPHVLVDATNIGTDATQSNLFEITLGGNRTLANPSNGVDGQRVVWEIIQDATGGRTLAFGNKFVFGETISAAVVSTAAGKRDFLGAIYNAAADKWYVVAFAKGY